MKRKVFFAIFLVIVAALAIILFKLVNKSSHPFCLITSPSQGKLLNLAKTQEGKAEFARAQDTYQKLIKQYPNSRNVANWQRHVEELNIKLIFSPNIIPGSIEYEIKPGDTLIRIAKEFNTTAELIAKSNNLDSSSIRPGNKIKVWNTPFSVLVDKSQNTLMLGAGDEVIKTYIVSTGVNNSTPTGAFKIVNKIPNPTWFKAGAVVPAGSPENILGSRWLGLDLPGYGIHGTTEPRDLGKQITQGCVRMANSDVEELYILLPPGTEVTIVD